MEPLSEMVKSSEKKGQIGERETEPAAPLVPS